MFNNPFAGAFGLDIGDLSIKLVQLRNRSLFCRHPRFELLRCRSIDLPPGLIANGELQKPEDIRRRIKKLIEGSQKQKAITSPWVVASLPETQSFIKLIHINKKEDELIDDDIILIAKKHIPFDEDNYYLQWQVIPNESEKEKKTRVLIGAVPKLISDSYTYLLESIGLGVVALEIEALSIARSMVTACKVYEDEARAILDLGATSSSLIVHDHNIIQFSTSLPFSGELITTALAQRLRISAEEAEEVKRKQGLDYESDNSLPWKIMVEFTNQLIDGIQDALNFYYSHFPEANRVTRIVLCGGGANLRKLDKIISTRLKITARPGLPWKNLQNRKEVSLPPEKSLGYATAIGLALRAADNPFFMHDII